MRAKAKIQKRLLAAAVIAGLFLLPFSALAADNLRHPELTKYETDGGRVEYLGNAYGLDGWLLIPKGQTPDKGMTAYTNNEGALVIGRLVNPSGDIETIGQVLAFKSRIEGSQEAMAGAERSGVSPAERVYAEVEKSHWVRVGKEDAPYLYMFMNVNCDHCQETWEALKGAVDAGRLQLRLAPYGAQETNRIGGAALLSADAPAKVWQSYIGGDKSALGAEQVRKGALDLIDRNTALVNKWKVQGVPFLIYRKLSDGKITAIAGKPENPLLLLADLAR